MRSISAAVFTVAVLLTGCGPTGMRTAEMMQPRDIGCVPLQGLRNDYTPPDLYKAFGACVRQGDYESAAYLFAAGGAYTRFDIHRVADDTAHGALSVMLINSTQGFTDQQRDGAQRAIQMVGQDPAKHQQICYQLTSMGPPNYYPRYMVNHGLRNAMRGGTDLVAIDPNATWAKILHDNLKCY